MTNKSLVTSRLSPSCLSHIEYKPLTAEAVQPVAADALSIGYDLIVPKDTIIPAHTRCYVPLEFSIGLPPHIEGKIESRSGFAGKGVEGLGCKWEWHLKWGVLPVVTRVSKKMRFDCDVLTGKIDPGYKGEVNVIVKNYDRSFIIPKGTKLAQMTFYQTRRANFTLVNAISGYDRGGGLGHSGSTINIGDNE